MADSHDYRRSVVAGILRGNTSEKMLEVTKRGEVITIDFFTQMSLEGRAFQVRAGTITTPLVGDVVCTDAAAEFCVDAPNALWSFIPVELGIGIRLATGTLHEYFVKSVGAVSTAGAAFVPLSLKSPGGSSTCTARVAAAGGVTVAAELATTTRQHWAFANPVVAGAGHEPASQLWTPRCPPVIAGPGCCYVQIAATGTGPSYYAHLDFIELETLDV